MTDYSAARATTPSRPAPADWAHGEVAIDEMPVDAVAHDVDGDKRPELLVRDLPGGKHELLVSTEQGIQQLPLVRGGLAVWLGGDTHPVDQVMLTEGQKIASYLPIPSVAGKPSAALALEQGGTFLHRLAADEAGVMRVVESVKPPAGAALRGDPVLGAVLVDQDRIVRLSRGQAKDMVSEPRPVAGLNADGDAARDLAVVSQDRLVIYVGRDQEAPG